MKVFTEKRTITKTNIGWCTHTWNPVWGCNYMCRYCYARGIARRFASVIAEENGVAEDDIRYFKPTWLENNFNREFPKKPARIFVNSMSDIGDWKAEWLTRVFDRISEHPEHQFIFLTKRTAFYWNLFMTSQSNKLGKSVFKAAKAGNLVFGVTATTEVQLLRASHYLHHFTKNGKIYSLISIEPIQEYIEPDSVRLYSIFKDSPHPDWLIIGPETGNSTNKIIPTSKWFDVWISYCMKHNIPLWEKESVRQYVFRELVQETPWDNVILKN